MFKLVKEVKDINRFREILVVLFEEGFDFLIEKIRLQHKIPVTKRVKAKRDKKESSIETRLRLALERLGPTFIKFGQVLSVRPDLIPKSYIRELEKLQDDVPPVPYETIEKLIKKEFGKSIPSLFSEFEKTPIASASISQVHKATLKNGKKVAVKIQRPDVKSMMETDIEIMFYVAKLLERHMPKLKDYNPVGIIDQFAKWTEKELDFKKEALNAKKFATNFADDKEIKIPEIYDELTTSTILVMEFIDGIELHNLKQIKKEKIDIRPFIKKGFEASLTQVFVHGFFHADPHPGNIIITRGHKLAFVDFGIVGHFDESLKEKSIDLFYGVIQNDADAIVDTLVKLSDTEIKNAEDLKYEISDLLVPLQTKNINEIKLSYVLEEVMDLALKYGLKIPTPFVLFGKTIITLEGIAIEYDPKFQLIKSSRPFLDKLIRQRYTPSNMVNSFMKDMSKFKKFAVELPDKTNEVLDKLEKGEIKVDIDDRDIENLSERIDRSSNRMAYSMLITAMLIVGALTINFGSPVVFKLPLISFLSFSIAFILALVLIISILKEKRIIE
jgi:ubiquinone biosynthesis protein